MTVRVYRSSDASAPVLTGAAGSLVALLDACLVNGYGALTAAGWTKPYTAANKGAYLQNLTGSNNPAGMYLYVDDSGPGTGSYREARVCGFETMSAITPTGTGQFPTGAQSTVGSGQLVVRKSNTADATARNWTLVANGQTIYLFIESGDITVPLAATAFVFGDFKSYKTSDQYAVSIIARTSENQSSAQYDPLHCLQISSTPNTAALNTTMFGHYIARHWTGIGGSIRFGKPSDFSRFAALNSAGQIIGPYTGETQTSAPNNSQNIGMGVNQTTWGQWPAPNGSDGAIALAPVYLCHNFSLRGYFPGLWQPMHNLPLGHNDSFTAAGGNLNGKSLLAQNIQAYLANSQLAGQAIVETSNTWS